MFRITTCVSLYYSWICLFSGFEVEWSGACPVYFLMHLVSMCVCFLPGACVVRDASGLLNDTLSPSSSSQDCVGLACQYGWDFTECINNNTCTYGISNYYQVSALSPAHKTPKWVKCVSSALLDIVFSLNDAAKHKLTPPKAWSCCVCSQVKDICLIFSLICQEQK